MKKLLLVLTLSGLLQGCAVQMASTAVGVVAGTAIGVAKVPFKSVALSLMSSAATKTSLDQMREFLPRAAVILKIPPTSLT